MIFINENNKNHLEKVIIYIIVAPAKCFAKMSSEFFFQNFFYSKCNSVVDSGGFLELSFF